jgi:hypothetical protein
VAGNMMAIKRGVYLDLAGQAKQRRSGSCRLMPQLQGRAADTSQAGVSKVQSLKHWLRNQRDVAICEEDEVFGAVMQKRRECRIEEGGAEVEGRRVSQRD